MLLQFRGDFLLLATDIIAIVLAPYASLWLRFDGNLPVQYTAMITSRLEYFLLTALVSFLAFRLYSRLWRYANLNDMLMIVAATATSSLLLAGVGYVEFPPGFPRSLYILNGFFLLIGVGASRFGLRAYEFYRVRLAPKDPKRRMLIVGAGDAGVMLAKEIMQRGKHSILGFIDDDEQKQGRKLLGLPILGKRQDIPAMAARYNASEIWIAMPSAPGDAVRKIFSICRQTPCRIRTLPSLLEIVDCQVSVSQLREIRLEDLLRRAPVRASKAPVAGYLSHKTVLVTGAGGSIGSELCRQIATFQPKSLLLLGKGENSIYDIHAELQRQYPALDLPPIIADVRDADRMEHIFKKWRPEVVFHAAAHKHVPLMELQPEEAIRNNVLGTWVVARTAASYAAERFILVSTDKAVKPSSVMGATKRAAEILIDELGRQTATKFAAVRFGNVLGSRGSVVPLFESQIAAGGPVTVTHPDMRRYFMTIPEAAELVLQAGAMGGAGGIFILNMGEPIRVLELAEDLIRLMGLEPYRDIAIEFSGVRLGEKINEELFYAAEEVVATSHPKIMQAVVPPVLTGTLEAFLADVVRCSTAKELFTSIAAEKSDERPKERSTESAGKNFSAANGDRKAQGVL